MRDGRALDSTRAQPLVQGIHSMRADVFAVSPSFMTAAHTTLPPRLEVHTHPVEPAGPTHASDSSESLRLRVKIRYALP